MHTYVDCHVHFWDVELMPYPWLDSEPRLPRQANAAHYRLATDEASPSQFVFVQAGAADAAGIAEARWVAAMCEGAPDFGGLVVWAPVASGARRLERHLEELSLDRVVGVRQLIQWERTGFCTTPAFIEAVGVLAALKLPFDICVFEHQLDDAYQLASSVPNASFILDHLGKPNIRGGSFETWESQIRRFASLENVSCKISGLVTEADHATWTIDTIRPYVETVLDIFGPYRLLWGSDWPVCLNATSHRTWFLITRELLSGLSGEEAKAIWSRTACRLYGLEGATIAGH